MVPLLVGGTRGADRARHRCRHPPGGALAPARERLRELAGTDQIPVLQTEDGQILRGTREIFAHLREREPWRFAAAHRRRFADHRDARESDATRKLLEYFRDTGDLESRELGADPAGDPEVVNVPAADRYELLLRGHRIGELAYRQRNGRIAFTHTNVNPACEGRGFGSRLAEAALNDARRQGLVVVPLCPFIAWYVEQHPEYVDLVAADYADRRDAP